MESQLIILTFHQRIISRRNNTPPILQKKQKHKTYLVIHRWILLVVGHSTVGLIHKHWSGNVAGVVDTGQYSVGTVQQSRVRGPHDVVAEFHQLHFHRQVSTLERKKWIQL